MFYGFPTLLACNTREFAARVLHLVFIRGPLATKVTQMTQNEAKVWFIVLGNFIMFPEDVDDFFNKKNHRVTIMSPQDVEFISEALTRKARNM